jgi:predicted lysophospholipase L1 biosynthesis ABC-type transport system permease subunit
LTARIVGVTRLVPSVDGDAVLGDLGTVTTALNADAPGSAVADEVWIRNASPAARALVQRRPFSLLAVESQQAVERALRSDPLARGTLWILVVTAAVALLLALTGIAVTALADRRDERRELFDLRVQGAGQRTLRSYLRIRSALVGAAGVILGIAAGAVLLGLVGGFVAATATGAAPVPPLHVRLDPALLAAWLVAFAAAAAIVVAALTRERA